MKSIPTFEELALLIKIFDTKSLTAAANVLNISKPAASRHLAHLRVIFNDPLFVKTQSGLIPSPKAEQLYPDITDLLIGMESLLNSENPDLLSRKAVISIACADNAPYSLFPKLVEEILCHAPNITLNFIPVSPTTLDELREQKLDFMVSPMIDDKPSEFHSLRMGLNRYVLVSGVNHPLVKLQSKYPEGIPDEEIAPYPFLDVLLQRGRTLTLREKVFPAWKNFHSHLRSTYFLPFIRSLSDNHLIVLPHRTAEKLAEQYHLEIIRTKSQSIVNYPHLFWHASKDKDPLLQWVRSIILSSVID